MECKRSRHEVAAFLVYKGPSTLTNELPRHRAIAVSLIKTGVLGKFCVYSPTVLRWVYAHSPMWTHPKAPRSQNCPFRPYSKSGFEFTDPYLPGFLVGFERGCMSTSIWMGGRLKASSPEYEIPCSVRVFSGEVLFPELLELLPGYAALALLKI